MNDDKKNSNNKIYYIIIVILIIIIITLLFAFFGYISSIENRKPTGNIDVFSIDCDCIFDDMDSIPSFGEDDDFGSDEGTVWVYKSSLNIFSNPAFEMNNIIAPESSNIYEFIVYNNIGRIVEYSFDVEETNLYNINMKYRLKLNGKYIIGNENEWVDASNLNKDYTLLENSGSDKYSLEWKWFSADNDTLIGEVDNATYGLNIAIKFRDSV